MRPVTFTSWRPLLTLNPWPYPSSTLNIRSVRVALLLVALLAVTLLTFIVPPAIRVFEEVRLDYSRLDRNAALLQLLEAFPRQQGEPFTTYMLDVGVANRVPLDRAVPDTRDPGCLHVTYETGGLDVSIIMPFHDESWSMLLRSLHSIIDRTPPHLLREVILIDDASHYGYMGEPLLTYLSVLSAKIRIFRNLRREGLIRSRVRAAKVARGRVLVFLDAHVEVNTAWLEPLLDHIRVKGGKVLAVPHIDTIDPQNITYMPWYQQVHGGFSWALEYVWKYLPTPLLVSLRPWVDPIPTPTTIGCAMAMDRDYFFRQGSFDEGMYIWGGENIEISFRTWMCGGEVNILPCSRVGHVFRKLLPYYFPYAYGGNETRYKNYQRLADVWMDEYKDYYYATSHLHLTYTKDELTSLDARRQLRKRLQCRNFSWFLANVIPEMALPPGGNVTYFGQISSSRGNSCVTRNSDTNQTYVSLMSCGRHMSDQAFYLSSEGHVKTTGKLCISANKSSKFLQLLPCGIQDERILQNFRFNLALRRPTAINDSPNVKDGRLTLTYRKKQLCMEQVTYLGGQTLAMNPCNDLDTNFQIWSFQYKFDFSVVKKKH